MKENNVHFNLQITLHVELKSIRCYFWLELAIAVLHFKNHFQNKIHLLNLQI